MEFKVEIFKAL